MSVYVDNMNATYGRMKMNHMVADTLAELHEMADKIGVKRKWFQNKASFPHYDICHSKMQMAVKLGAVPLSMMDLGRYIRKLRQTDEYSPEKLKAIYHTTVSKGEA